LQLPSFGPPNHSRIPVQNGLLSCFDDLPFDDFEDVSEMCTEELEAMSTFKQIYKITNWIGRKIENYRKVIDVIYFRRIRIVHFYKKLNFR
jgi:hypothetical protein